MMEIRIDKEEEETFETILDCQLNSDGCSCPACELARKLQTLYYKKTTENHQH